MLDNGTGNCYDTIFNMSMLLHEIPRIPVYEIPSRHVTPATSEKPNGDVEHALQNAHLVCESGNHCLRILEAPRPHTAQRHWIGWIDKGPTYDGTSGPHPWSDSSWSEVAQDQNSLRSLEQFIAGAQMANPVLRVYFIIGFHPTDKETPEYQYKRGLQSIWRGHIHFVETQQNKIPIRYLEPDNPYDAHTLLRFLNVSGEESIEHFAPAMDHFGEKIILKQPIDSCTAGQKIVIDRTLFRQLDIQTALQNSLSLLAITQPAWLDLTKTISEQWVSLGSSSYQLKHTPVPGVSVIFPSLIDRKNFSLSDEDNILIQPLSVCGPMNIFEPGGGVFEWVTLPE
jgi:hypothetical protein